MPAREILELIMQELTRVQERAESLRALEHDAASDAETAVKISTQIEAAVQNIRKMIREYERLEEDKPA